MTLNPERDDPVNGDCNPNTLDWDRIVQEVIATQREVADLRSGLTALIAIRIGCFVCPAVVGHYSVSGFGFKPKAVKFWVSKGPGLQTHFCCCQGMMDAYGNQNSMTWAGVWSNIFKGDSRNDLCMYTINSSGISQVTGQYVSMDTGGFTLNFIAVNPAFIVRWEAIG